MGEEINEDKKTSRRLSKEERRKNESEEERKARRERKRLKKQQQRQQQQQENNDSSNEEDVEVSMKKNQKTKLAKDSSSDEETQEKGTRRGNEKKPKPKYKLKSKSKSKSGQPEIESNSSSSDEEQRASRRHQNPKRQKSPVTHHPVQRNTPKTTTIISNAITDALSQALVQTGISRVLRLGLSPPAGPTIPRQLKRDTTDNTSSMKLKICFTDDLPEDPHVLHPMVQVHLVDAVTGQYVLKSDPRVCVTNAFEHSTVINGETGERSTATCAFIPPVCTKPCPLGQSNDNQDAPNWNEELVLNENIDVLLSSNNLVMLFEFFDIGPQIVTNGGKYPIAWAYFRPTKEGREYFKAEVMTPVRLQLYRVQRPTWLTSSQSRQAGYLDPDRDPPVPPIFRQFRHARLSKFPSTLHIECGIEQNRKTEQVRHRRPEHVFEIESHELTLQHFLEQEKTADEGCSGSVEQNVTDEEASRRPAGQSLMMKTRRHPDESCLIPQRNIVLHSLPREDVGCMCLAFSPSGNYLACACADESGAFPIRLVDVTKHEPTFFKNLYGHHGLVYCLKFCPENDSQLVSASADGTIRVWNHATRERHSVLVFERPDQLTFHYVVEYHHTLEDKSHVVFSAGLDHRIHMWNTKPKSEGCAFIGTLNISSSESFPNEKLQEEGGMQCLVFDGKHSRLFSGDATGQILVWKFRDNGMLPEQYQVLRKIQMTEAITHLALHPRKNHLLVQTKGNVLCQYELRSYVVIHKGYPGIQCTADLIKNTFSPDGRFVLSGSEDGEA